MVGPVVLGLWMMSARLSSRKLYAVGANEPAAFLMASSRPCPSFMFVVAGVAQRGVLLTLQAASPTVALGMELDALTVVLLGGVTFAGGSGGGYSSSGC